MTADEVLVGQTASALAERVRSAEVKPVEVVRAHLEQIDAVDSRVGAYQLVRAERALAEAEEVGAREDLPGLPLAGVPVAVKDTVAVAGEPRRRGSAATPDAPSPGDDEVVRRLREAGAVVIGLTRLPELGLWGTTDGAYGVSRSPWRLDRTAGGSSGGSAAAVASAQVPVAHANDGLGSIRIPAACCGVVGFKPGSGVVPSAAGPENWFRLSENGAIATTVTDVALMLSVMAGRPEWRDPRPIGRRLRIAVSTKPPVLGVKLDAACAEAVTATARAFADAGHEVGTADPPYPTWVASAIVARWFAGPLRQLEGVDRSRLERRTRGHLRAGRTVSRLGLIRETHRDRYRAMLERFFVSHDLLLLPSLATPPLAADGWSRRSWLANVVANVRFAPFAGAWNLTGFPAASVPAGIHPDGTPIGVQLAGPPGAEPLLLSAMAQIEASRPWPRHAPLAGIG